jgi:ArsR family transcriptional regulator
LLNVAQEGRYQRYRANLAVMQELIVYLTAECCTGHPEQCFENQPTSVLCDTETNSSPIDQIDSYL